MNLDVAQRSPDWIAARLGSLGASRLHEAIAKTKSGYAASRNNLMADLIIERLTGQPAPQHVTAAMQWGIEQEAAARAAYEFLTNSTVAECGLFVHPHIPYTHASPDGLIGEDGLIEIKCPNTAQHIDTLLGAPIEHRYVLQMQWQMACTGRQWCDYVSFDPRLPMPLHLHVRRVERDSKMIEELEHEVVKFLEELDAKLAKLQRLSAAQMPAGDEEPQPAKRRPSVVAPEKRIVQRLALACKEPLFRRYLSELFACDCWDEADAADLVRVHCRVSSRSAIVEGTEAARRAHALLEDFAAWRDHPELTA
jgi:putative phage-type endonuclease